MLYLVAYLLIKSGKQYHSFLTIIFSSMEKQKSSFFFGGESGKIYIADDLKYSCEICKVSGSIKSLLFYDKYNSFVIVSSNLLLVQFRIDKLVPDKRVSFNKLIQLTNIGKIISSWRSRKSSNNMGRKWPSRCCERREYDQTVQYLTR